MSNPRQLQPEEAPAGARSVAGQGEGAVPRRVASARARVAIGVLAGAALLFAALTLLALQTGPSGFDLAASRWLQSWSNPALTWFMVVISWPGFAPRSYVLPFLVAGIVALRRSYPDALWVLGSQCAPLLNRLLKELIQRQRPTPEYVQPYAELFDYSFPSGHVVQYTSLFGFTFFLVYVLVRPSRWRSLVLVLLGLAIVLVGPSRIYLGEHWLSDVLGGYALAALWLVPYCWAYARLRLRAS